jgi:cellobiose dehydrogenase (acceptor)
MNKWPAGWKWDDVKAAVERLFACNPGTTLASSDHKRYDQGAFNTMSRFLNSMGWSQADAIEKPNAKHQIYSYPPWDIQNGLRAGPVTSYLPLAQANSNFQLSLNTKVLRAVRDGSTVTAGEVETSSGNRQIINVNPGGKVILAAGTM